MSADAGFRADDDRCPTCLKFDPLVAGGSTALMCDCSVEERGYGMVREAIVEHLNPPDDDVSEESILIAAVARAAGFIEAQPCSCDAPDGEACDRCIALGRFANERLGR